MGGYPYCPGCPEPACDKGYVDIIHDNERWRYWEDGGGTRLWRGAGPNHLNQHVESGRDCGLVFYEIDTAEDTLYQWGRNVTNGSNETEPYWDAELGDLLVQGAWLSWPRDDMFACKSRGGNFAIVSPAEYVGPLPGVPNVWKPDWVQIRSFSTGAIVNEGYLELETTDDAECVNPRGCVWVIPLDDDYIETLTRLVITSPFSVAPSERWHVRRWYFIDGVWRMDRTKDPSDVCVVTASTPDIESTTSESSGSIAVLGGRWVPGFVNSGDETIDLAESDSSGYTSTQADVTGFLSAHCARLYATGAYASNSQAEQFARYNPATDTIERFPNITMGASGDLDEFQVAYVVKDNLTDSPGCAGLADDEQCGDDSGEEDAPDPNCDCEELFDYFDGGIEPAGITCPEGAEDACDEETLHDFACVNISTGGGIFDTSPCATVGFESVVFSVTGTAVQDAGSLEAITFTNFGNGGVGSYVKAFQANQDWLLCLSAAGDVTFTATITMDNGCVKIVSVTYDVGVILGF